MCHYFKVKKRSMRILESTYPTDTQKVQIFNLWNNEYPKELNFDDLRALDDYLESLSETTHYFLEDDNHEVLGWACKFSRDHEKWFAIILNQKIQGLGQGTALLNEVKKN